MPRRSACVNFSGSKFAPSLVAISLFLRTRSAVANNSSINLPVYIGDRLAARRAQGKPADSNEFSGTASPTARAKRLGPASGRRLFLTCTRDFERGTLRHIANFPEWNKFRIRSPRNTAIIRLFARLSAKCRRFDTARLLWPSEPYSATPCADALSGTGRLPIMKTWRAVGRANRSRHNRLRPLTRRRNPVSN